MSLSSCLKKAGRTFDTKEKLAMNLAANKLASGGMDRAAAEMAAVEAALNEARAEHQEVVDAVFDELPSLAEKFSRGSNRADAQLKAMDEQAAPKDAQFDSEAFDKKRNDTIKASRDAGVIHLDKVTAAVETMRGREIFYVHDTKQRGVVRTVDNNGNVYVQWSDEYSAQKELASKAEEPNKSWLKSKHPIWRESKDGKTFVYESSLGTSDLKDYAFADSVKSAAPKVEAPAETEQQAQPPETAKEPWQMTRAEVGTSLNARGWKSARGVMVVAPSPESGLYETTHKSNVDVYLPEAKAEQYIRDYNETAHRRHVEYALANGKPVPAEVLAEYPDLKVAETADTGDAAAKVDENTGLPLNEDGTVSVYHHTTPQTAAQIRATGVLRSAAEPDVYVTSRAEPDTGYGDASVLIRVQPDKLMLDDEFPDGRRDFRLNVGKPRGQIAVQVENESSSGSAPPVTRETPNGTAMLSRNTTSKGVNLPINEANREQTDQLESELKQQGVDFTITPVSLPVDASADAARRQIGTRPKDSFSLAQRIAGLFNKKIIWMQADGDFSINGAITSGMPDYVFIDARTEKPAHVVFGHELSHHMKKDAPAVYRDLQKAISGLIKNHEEYRRKFGIEDSFADDYVTKEIIGDLLGDNFGKQSFWDQVAQESGGTFKKIASTIRQWLNGIIDKIKGVKGFGSDQFVTDVLAARKALVVATFKYMRDQRAQTNIESKFNRADLNLKGDGRDFDESAYRSSVVQWAKDKWGDAKAPDGSTVWQNFTEWFGDSKVVDADGKPLVVYHGTPDATFYVFKDEQYFSPNPKVAGIYMSTSASSIASRRKDGESQAVYPVFLKIETPFDTRIPSVKRQFEREFFNKYGNGTPLTKKGLPDWTDASDIAEWINETGQKFDGIVVDEGGLPQQDGSIFDRGISYVPLRGNQVKSATGNNGQFDGKNPDIRFSRGIAGAQSSQPVSNYVSALLQSPGKLGWLNGINTQYHKALMLARKGMPELKAVFDRTQDYLNDITSIAVSAEQEAPAIFRELRGISVGAFKQYFKGAASEADIAATQPALHVGTLFGGGNPMDGRKWSDEELKYGGAILSAKGANLDKIPTTFKKELKRMPAGEMRLPNLFAPLTDKQIELYKQARATVDKSLEDQAKSIIYRQVKSKGIEFDKGMNLADAAKISQDKLDEAIEAATERENALTDQLDPLAGDEANARTQNLIDKAVSDKAELVALKETVAKIEAKANGLIEHGYMPVQRFGNRVVVAKDEKGKTQFVGFYDGNPLIPKSADVEMNRAAMQLRHDNPTWTVTTERKSERAWQLYQGLNLDALENFLDFLDPETKANLERDETIQAYMQNAVNSRSTLTRMIHRKGTPGFSTDIPRTLASFITSNARSAAANYHGGAMKSLVEDIKQGDIKDEAADLVKYVLEPQEEAAKIRSFLFFHFLGGSIAAGLVNLSQTPMMTAPALLEHADIAKVTSVLKSAAKAAVLDPKTIAGERGKALQRAEQEGVTAPQMVYHLSAVAANNPFSGNRRFRTFMAMWGGLFSTTEVFNRRVAFMAAYDIAQADKSKGDPYEFAKNIVNATQLIYNKGNRPNLGRGAIGATVLTFKAFSIGYLELLRRLPPKQQLMMLGMLVLMAGAEGLPFSEDIMDLVDTLGQALGFSTNTGKWLGKTVRDNLGDEFERPLLKGLGGMLPIALHSRLGFGNIIPATAYFKQSEIDKTRDVAEAVGPLGSVLKSFSDSLQMLARGRWDAAAVNAAPKAVRDAYNGAHMIATGEAQDTKGRLTLKDVSAGEAAGKFIGFNPQRASIESETKREAMLDKNLRTVRMDEIAGDWADGIVRKDPEKVAEARDRLRQWNTDNPELRIMGPSLMHSIQERVRAARMTGEQRFLKSLPKVMRPEVRQEFSR